MPNAESPNLDLQHCLPGPEQYRNTGNFAIATSHETNCEFLFVFFTHLLPCLFVIFFADKVLCTIAKITNYKYIIIFLQFMKFMFILMMVEYLFRKVNIFFHLFERGLQTDSFPYLLRRRLEYIFRTFRIRIILNKAHFIKLQLLCM